MSDPIDRRAVIDAFWKALFKRFNNDKNVYVTIDYFEPYDAYEIRMSEYDHERYAIRRVKKLIRVSDLLSAKIPTHEVFAKVLNEMYEELKKGDGER